MSNIEEPGMPLVEGTTLTPIVRSTESHPVVQQPGTNDSDGAPVTDPRITSLAAIFPDFDQTILSDVLDSCNGNQDHAIEVLLGMSDPSYKTRVPENSQFDLDEQLAHRLAEEEEEDATYQIPPPSAPLPYVPRTPRRSNEHARPVEEVPSQSQFRDFFVPASTRSRSTNGQEPSSSRTGNEIQDQFMRIADTGKRTFNNIFSKVKAKLQEFDQPTNPPDSAPAPTSVPPQTYSEVYHSAPNPVVPSSMGSTIVNEDGGYDLTPAPITISRTASNPNSSAIHESTLPLNIAEESLKPSSAPTPAPSTSPSAVSSLDRSKLGLLPRRPKSLIVDNPPPIPTSSGGESLSEPHDDDDEDLYLPNPYDAQKP